MKRGSAFGISFPADGGVGFQPPGRVQRHVCPWCRGHGRSWWRRCGFLRCRHTRHDHITRNGIHVGYRVPSRGCL